MTDSKAPAAAPHSVARAIACMVAAIFLFSTMNATIKWLSGTYHITQVMFFRGLFALVALLPFIASAGGLSSLRTARPWGHAWRCGVGIASMTCGFTAISLLPLANAVALGFTAPLFTTVLGVIILGEKVRWRRTLALLVGFSGVLIILQPALTQGGGLQASLNIGSLLGLMSACLGALAMISIRRLSGTEPSTTIVFYFMLSATVASGLFLPFTFVAPTLRDLGLLIAIGLIGGVAQVLLTHAYRNAPVAVISPFHYTAMIWATCWGYLVWGELPGSHVVAGVCVVVASGVYITLREVKLGVSSVPPSKLRGELP